MTPLTGQPAANGVVDSTPERLQWAVGHTFRSAARTVTETDIVTFAGLSGDYNRLHVDAVYAQDTRYGQRIAHGLLVLAILSGQTTQTAEYRAMEPFILALRELTVRFPKPTFIGDTIHARVTLAERQPDKPGRERVLLRREAVNQRDEVVVQADFSMLLRTGASA